MAYIPGMPSELQPLAQPTTTTTSTPTKPPATSKPKDRPTTPTAPPPGATTPKSDTPGDINVVQTAPTTTTTSAPAAPTTAAPYTPPTTRTPGGVATHNPYNPQNVPNAPYTPKGGGTTVTTSAPATPGTIPPNTGTITEAGGTTSATGGGTAVEGGSTTATTTTTTAAEETASSGSTSDFQKAMDEYKEKLKGLGYDADKIKVMLEKYRGEYDEYRKAYSDWAKKYGDPEYIKKQRAEAQQFASEEAQRVAAAAGQNASSQARAMGLSPAQAALMGSQQMGGLFSGQYGDALKREQGLQQQNFQNVMGALQGAQGATAGGAGLATAIGQEDFKKLTFDLQNILAQAGLDQNAINAYLQEKGIDAGVTSATGAQNAGLAGGLLSGLAGLLPFLFSDEDVKIDSSSPVNALESVIKSIGSHGYKYKKGVGEDPSKQHYGPMAQEIEETPLRDAVVDTPKGKMVDTRRLTMGNTSLIAELGKKVDDLYSYIKENRK